MKFLDFEMIDEHRELVENLAESLATAAYEISLTKNRHSKKANKTCEDFLEDVIEECKEAIGKTDARKYSFIANTIMVCTKAYIKDKGYTRFSREAKEFHSLAGSSIDVKADLVSLDFVSLINRISNIIATRA